MDYRECINEIHKTKLDFNNRKLDLNGKFYDIIDKNGIIKTITRKEGENAQFFNTDDHGWIPWDKPILFEPEYNYKDEYAVGCAAIGRNFKLWLEAHPAYIHKHSAIAGAWVGPVPFKMTWKDEYKADHLEPLREKYGLRGGTYGMNHMAPDAEIGLKLGWGGLLNKIRQYRDFINPEDKAFFYGEEQLVLGIQKYVANHAEKAREMALNETDEEVKNNLLEIADMNEWLVNNPPRTLREAVQFTAHLQSIDRMYFFGGALCQIDELFRPFYEADIKKNIIDSDDEVIWYIASLLFNDTHYSQIGGLNPAGYDVASPMSHFVLEATHLLKIPQNIGLRVHNDMDDDLYEKSIKYLLEDGTGVCYSCATGIEKGYMKNGIPEQIARLRIKVGCNWCAIPGQEYCLQDVTRFCLITPFMIAFDEVVRDKSIESTLDNIWECYVKHLTISVDTIKKCFDWHMKYKHLNTPEIVLNLFTEKAIERGVDASAGGCDIINLTCDGIALATIADSIAALEQRIVNEKRMSFDEIADVLDSNYKDNEYVRLMMKSIERYGSGGSRADYWAKKVSLLYTDLMKSTPTPDGYNVIPGIFSHGDVYSLGANLKATPNGRKAGEEISHSADPDPGFTKVQTAAPTMKSNAVANVQPGYGNSAPLQIDLDSTLIKQAGGVNAVKALIKTHNDLGGTLVNINVLSKEKLMEAHKDPSKYPDLVVRVTGYSAYFCSLSPEYRQQVIDRFLS